MGVVIFIPTADAIQEDLGKIMFMDELMEAKRGDERWARQTSWKQQRFIMPQSTASAPSDHVYVG